MNAAAVALALGLVGAPSPGMTIAEALAALGSGAAFGPGCIEGDGTRTLVAPARWRAAGPPLDLMAELKGRTVSAVHLADGGANRVDEAECRARLDAFVGVRPAGPQSVRDNGPTRIIERHAPRIAGYAASYRALYRASRGACRVMLTIEA